MKELRNTLDEIAKTGGNDTQAKRVVELMKAIDRKLSKEIYTKKDEYTAYNSLFLAIIRYNLNDFDSSRVLANMARRYTASDKSSVLDYVDALLAFQAGDDPKTVKLLTEAEPKASTPYIVLGQNAFDAGNYHEAFDILDRGIKAGSSWLDDAISEVDDNAEMVAELRRQYSAD